MRTVGYCRFVNDRVRCKTEKHESLTSKSYTLTYFLTYLLTPWSRVLLEKPTGSHLVKKFPVFYGTWKIITAFKSARHLSLSWAISIQSMPTHPTSWRSISILSSRLCLGLPSGIFPQISPPKPWINLSFTPQVLHDRPISFFSTWSREKYWVRYKENLAPRYVVYPAPLLPRPKYSPQHPILKHPQPTFFPHFERPSLTPKQNPQNHRRYLFLFIRILVSCVTMWRNGATSKPTNLNCF